ncbi:polysaccharide biosynthesis/export family protein, partial [Paracoccus sp. (in: a-proteobacteria)]|uniref:polysaccharide biosynthesis/export family protein n=1 Tax=Paracoccus sp. TaxID=267 RepID=UPI0035B27D59
MTCHRPSRLDLRIGPCRGTGHRRAPLAAPLALAGLLAASGGAATAQEAALFPIERGDVLAVTVLDEPSLSREAKVDALGRIMLPQIGSVSIAGHDLDQVRELIEAELSGRDILVDPQVIVEVASYRPIYVGGAVDTQGAVPFEPGLTVRHALLLAGGVERKDGMA